MCVFSCKFHTFPVTEGNKIQHIYSSSRPQQEISPTTQNSNISTNKKDANFGNTIILCDFGPENPQNPTQKDRNFEKMHSLTSAKYPQIRKVFIFPEFCTFCTIIQMHSITSSNTNQLIIFPWEHLVTQLSNLAD